MMQQWANRQLCKYGIAELFGSGKFGEFGESSVVRQTLTSQILAYKWYPYG